MKMKKFINAPETITDEELVGLGLAYPDIVDVDGHLVISKDLKDADRVTIVTYGGRHRPASSEKECWMCRRWAIFLRPPTRSWYLMP